jgi:hypothetical protein
MPHISKKHMKESIILFANDILEIINEKLNLNDLSRREDIPCIEHNGWYYYLHKSIANIQPEIRVKRQNYRMYDTKFYKDQPKGNRINEEAWIYKKGMNCYILGINEKGELIHDKDHGFIINDFSIQHYNKTAF